MAGKPGITYWFSSHPLFSSFRFLSSSETSIFRTSSSDNRIPRFMAQFMTLRTVFCLKFSIVDVSSIFKCKAIPPKSEATYPVTRTDTSMHSQAQQIPPMTPSPNGSDPISQFVVDDLRSASSCAELVDFSFIIDISNMNVRRWMSC